MPKSVKLSNVFQARVTINVKGAHRKLREVLQGKPKNTTPVNFDSQLVFATMDLAEKFVPYYVRELIEMQALDMNDTYEAGVITLNMFDGTIDVNGVEAAS